MVGTVPAVIDDRLSRASVVLLEPTTRPLLFTVPIARQSTIRNPLPPPTTPIRSGNQMALDNVRERLKFAWPGQARVVVESDEGHFGVHIELPYEPLTP